MKKRIVFACVMTLATLNCRAQIYGGDVATTFPTPDLYDSGMMNMYLRALAETSVKRKQNYDLYSELAYKAFNNKEWNNAIRYVNYALETQYYSETLYYIRGYAYEQLGNLRAAKKDYKKGKKHGSLDAARALESLKLRSKYRKE